MREEHQEKIKENNVNMLDENLAEVIQYHIENKMLLNVERERISGSVRLIGFPIILTNEFLLMTNIYDFNDEGYALIRTCDITDVYSRDEDSFFEMICIQEKLQDKIDACPIHTVTDVKAFLTNMEKDRYISIHCEYDNINCNFFLGQSKTVTDNYIEFASIGIDGCWNKDLDIITISDITMIVFDDKYSNMYYKYSLEKN